MPPQDPMMPEGTDSIIDGTDDFGGTSGGTGSGGLGGSGMTGSSGMGSSGFDDFDKPMTGGSSLGSGLGSSSTSSSGTGGSTSVSGMADNVASKAGASMDVQSLKSQASDKARDMASQGKDKATEALDSVSRLVSETADTVDDRLGPQYGNYVRKAGEALDGLNSSLRGKEVDELFDDARNLVRKSPAVAIGAAAAIGFLLIRLVKSGMPASTGSDDDYYTSNSGSTMTGLPPRVDNSYDPNA